MFGRRKKKNTWINSVSNQKVTVYDFRLRSSALFESYSPPDYIPYPKMVDTTLRAELDKHINALFQGTVDDGMEDALTNYIFSTVREAICSYTKQRVDHDEIIRRLVIRDRADHQDFENMRKIVDSELQSLEEELNVVNQKISSAAT